MRIAYPEAAAEAEAAYRRYITDFGTLILDCVASGGDLQLGSLGFWTFPFLNLTASPPRIEQEAAFTALLRDRYRGYHADGWRGRVEIERAVVAAASPTLAVVEAEGTRHRTDGSLLNRWSSVYVLRRDGAGWRTVILAPIEAAYSDLETWLAWASAIQR